MAIKKNTNLEVMNMLAKVKSAVKAKSNTQYIPNIIEFCESPYYLNLPKNNIKLFPMQRIILKVYYRGQPGNESLKLNEEEMKLLFEYKLDGVIAKYHSGALFKELVLVLGRRCVSEDTTIVDPCSGKEWRLGEMWDYGKVNGIMSWTYDERTQDMKIIPNCELINQGVRPVYRLETKSGHEIEATDNHPFMTQRGWIELKDLDIQKDKVAIVESVPFFGSSDAISKNEAAVLGYMTGDGCCSQSGMFFTCANDEVLCDFKDKISRISNNLIVIKDKWTTAKSKQYQYKIRSKDKLQEKYYNEKTQKVMSKLSQSDLQKLLARYGLLGKTCHYKTAPKALFECPKNIIASYLRALYSCDGGIEVKTKAVEISFYTVNKKQSHCIQSLLTKFGIFSTLRIKRAKTQIKKECDKIYDSISYRVCFSKSKYVYIFLRNIGWVGKPKTIYKALEICTKNYDKRKLPVKNLVFQQIESIKILGNKRTFDIQVSDKPSEQNFTCNGVLCHNSGKDFLVSLIALYEVMRLLEIPGGCPFKYYNMAEGNPIFILTVATSSDQARIMFTEIKEKMTSSEYFRDKVGHMEADKISLLTPRDRTKSKKLVEDGLDNAASKIKGSVVIMSGHSNSESLLGKRIYCCAKGSMVISGKGLLPIEEFCKTNDEVDEILHGLEGVVVANKCFDNGIKNTLIMNFLSGNKIEITPQHKLYVWDEEYQRCEFKKASEIENGNFILGQYGQNLWGLQKNINFSWTKKPNKFGDKILCPICYEEKEQINSQHLKTHNLTCKEFSRLYPEFPVRSDVALSKFNNMKDNLIPKVMTLELSRLMGYIVSGGNNTQNNVNITNTDPDVVEDIRLCLNRSFVNAKYKTERRKIDKKHWEKRHQFFLFDKKERELLNHLGCKVCLSDKKEIPKSILLSPKRLICEFLKAYFEGDGCISNDRICASSTSECLIAQIYYVLLNMGIFSTIQYKPTRNSKHKDQWIISLYGKDILEYKKQIGFISNRKKNSLKILSSQIQKKSRKRNKFGLPVGNLIKNINKNNKSLKKFARKYGFYGFSKQDTISLDTIQEWQRIYHQNNIKSPLDEIVNSKLFGDQVVKIKPSKNQVYDFHVCSKSHSYCCNGLINHNSLLLDEVASFKTTGGPTSGDRIYSALTPATADFIRRTGEFNDEGKEINITDSKIISISSPRSEEGMLFKLYKETNETPTRLSIKLPTWKVNLNITQETLRQEFKFMTENEFNMEFGAEFSGTAGEKFIPDMYVDKAIALGIELGLDQRMAGIPGMIYYAHLDPALSSHNYALIIIHSEERVRLAERGDQIVKEKIKIFIVDHIQVWQPEGNKSINVYEVDKYITNLARRFRFAMVSYDSWNSEASVRMLRTKGIPTKITPFRRDYKMKIYDNLEQLLVNNQIAIPRRGQFSEMLEMELKCLKRVYLPTGFKIGPNPDAPITTDDVCDALSGALGSALTNIYTGYPQTGVVSMPQIPSTGEHSGWNIGRGHYSGNQWKHYHNKFGI